MMLVKTRIDTSPIDGYGLFAVERIARDTPVWRFTPPFDQDLSPDVLDSLSPDQREWMLKYGYIDLHSQRLILCGDDARFINHSDTPNIAADFSLDPYGLDIAVRDIEAGEEITSDYMTFEGKRP
jgi:uncharacterized protein